MQPLKTSHPLALLLACMILLLGLMPVTAYGDIGPKPSVELALEGLDGRVCYVTLLSQAKSTGPYSVSDHPISPDHYLVEGDPEYGLKVWEAFRNYQDADGFYFIEYFARCGEDGTFRWGYYPPATFKVLLYFPQSGEFAVSGICQQYAFDSYFTVTAEGGGLSIVKSYDYTHELLSLGARIGATIAVEMAVALLLGLRGKNLLLFLAVLNTLTQVILNLLLNYFDYSQGSWAFVFHYIWMELAVTALEAVACSFWFRRAGMEKKWIAPAYALAANAASFAVGLAVAHLVPGIF